MTAPSLELEIGQAPVALYRLYDVAGVLLYIGITDNLRQRFKQHAADKPWWPEVTRQTVQWLEDRDAALAAESQAITAERPRHNIAGSSDNSPRRTTGTAAAPARQYSEGELVQMLRVQERALVKTFTITKRLTPHGAALMHAREALDACQAACAALSALIADADQEPAVEDPAA